MTYLRKIILSNNKEKVEIRCKIKSKLLYLYDTFGNLSEEESKTSFYFDTDFGNLPEQDIKTSFYFGSRKTNAIKVRSDDFVVWGIKWTNNLSRFNNLLLIFLEGQEEIRIEIDLKSIDKDYYRNYSKISLSNEFIISYNNLNIKRSIVF